MASFFETRPEQQYSLPPADLYLDYLEQGVQDYGVSEPGRDISRRSASVCACFNRVHKDCAARAQPPGRLGDSQLGKIPNGEFNEWAKLL